MDITMKKFILNRTKNGLKYYVHLHNTVSLEYSGDIRKVVICNMSKEVKEQLKDQPDKMFVEEANGFLSLTLVNAFPTVVLVFNDIKLGELKEYDE